MTPATLMSAIGLVVVATMIAQTRATSPRARRGSSAPNHHAADPQRRYWASNFDEHATRLPPQFNGNSIEALFAAIEKANVNEKKREFETTEQWNERLRQEQLRPLLGTLLRTSTYGFLLDPDTYYDSSVRVTYDADKALFNIKVEMNTTRDPLGNRMDTSGLSILRTKERVRTYRASNAFGATREVEEFSSVIFKVRAANLVRVHHLEIPVPAHEARAVGPQIRVLAVCKLIVPFPEEGVYGIHTIAATLDEPIAVSNWERYINVNVESLWVYNYSSGIIYTALKIE